MSIPRDVPRNEKALAKAKTEAMNKFLRDYDDFLDHYHSTYYECDQQLTLNLEID